MEKSNQSSIFSYAPVPHFIKSRVLPMLRFKSFDTATSIILRLAVMHMIKKEQIDLRD